MEGKSLGSYYILVSRLFGEGNLTLIREKSGISEYSYM